MALFDDLTRLHEMRETGSVSGREFGHTLKGLVEGEHPRDAEAMAEELRRLKYEAALTLLDKEFEAIRQECLGLVYIAESYGNSLTLNSLRASRAPPHD